MLGDGAWIVPAGGYDNVFPLECGTHVRFLVGFSAWWRVGAITTARASGIGGIGHRQTVTQRIADDISWWSSYLPRKQLVGKSVLRLLSKAPKALSTKSIGHEGTTHKAAVCEAQVFQSTCVCVVNVHEAPMNMGLRDPTNAVSSLEVFFPFPFVNTLGILDFTNPQHTGSGILRKTRDFAFEASFPTSNFYRERATGQYQFVRLLSSWVLHNQGLRLQELQFSVGKEVIRTDEWSFRVARQWRTGRCSQFWCCSRHLKPLFVGHMRDTAAATTADLGIWSFVFHGLRRRGWISCSLPSDLDGKHMEQQSWSKDTQVHLGCLFSLRDLGRTFNSNAF